MTKSKPYLPWPGADDRIVVEEMLRDPQSRQWYECREFVKKRVQFKAKNIPQDLWDDLIQEAMIRVNKSLHTFKYECALRNWVFGIVRSCIIDAYRKSTSAGKVKAPQGDLYHHSDCEEEAFAMHTSRTPEDEYIIRDEIAKALAILLEYVSTHANPIRNGRILDMVMFEGRSLEEAAKAVGCSAPVAGYVVREARRYAREKLGH